MSQRRTYDALTVAEARHRIIEEITPLPTVVATAREALGCVLAEPFFAPSDSPRFSNSAMDGYAVRWTDVKTVDKTNPSTFVRLKVVATIAAGAECDVHVSASEAARIMTGGRIPAGTDTVVKREQTDEDTDSVTIRELPPAKRGAHIRPQGSHFETGLLLLPAGSQVNPGVVGLLASVGRMTVAIHRRPRVVVVSTGDEIVEVDEVPSPTQIFNSASHLVTALIGTEGGIPIVLKTARDTEGDCRRAFSDAFASADLVISLGGVSVGDFDVVKSVVTGLGADIKFWGVKMKPGKPLVFGVSDECPFIGLPGNPVSAFVCFYQYVRPIIRCMLGFRESDRLPVVKARLACTTKGSRWRADYQRGELTKGVSGWVFEPYSDQSSANLMSLPGATGLGIVPEGVQNLTAGAEIEVERLPTFGGEPPN